MCLLHVYMYLRRSSLAKIHNGLDLLFKMKVNMCRTDINQLRLTLYALGLGDIDFFCVSRYLMRVSRYTRYIGGIQIIGNQSDT